MAYKLGASATRLQKDFWGTWVYLGFDYELEINWSGFWVGN